MKNGKRLKVSERLYLESINLNPEEWLISKKTSEFWLIIHRMNGQVEKIPVPWKG